MILPSTVGPGGIESFFMGYGQNLSKGKLPGDE